MYIDNWDIMSLQDSLMSVSLSGEQKGDINVRKPYFLSYLFPAAAVVTSELGHHDIMCTVCLVFSVQCEDSELEGGENASIRGEKRTS